MKKVILVCIIALLAAFTFTGCKGAGEVNDCCQSSSASEKQDCCQDKDTQDSSSETLSNVPDCCAGE